MGGCTYRRSIYVGETPVALAVRQVGFRDTPRLRVRVFGGCEPGYAEAEVRRTLNHVLGLDVDLTAFYALAASKPPLDVLAERFRGMRPPRFPTVFEALVNGVACQQFSLQAGLTLLNRLVAAFGQAPTPAMTLARAFPRPEALLNGGISSLRALGFSRAKSLAIAEMAVVAISGELAYERFAALNDSAARARLQSLRGVGRWTADYVLLRGCGRLNIFPGDDVGARNNLRKWLGKRRPLDYDGTMKLLKRWEPYAGLVYLHLLLKHLDDGMVLKPSDASGGVAENDSWACQLGSHQS